MTDPPPAISVANPELVSVRDLMRGLPAQLDRLERGEVDKLVALQGNAMRAVIVTAERWGQMQAAYRTQTGRELA